MLHSRPEFQLPRTSLAVALRERMLDSHVVQQELWGVLGPYLQLDDLPLDRLLVEGVAEEHAFEVALDQEVFPLGEAASLDCKQGDALHKKVAFQE